MRFSAVAAAVCLSLSPMAGGIAATPPPAMPVDVPAADAAAKHAKRTACLKDAKAKKLVGAEKTAFLKNCIAAP
jgi:hypothetical protein